MESQLKRKRESFEALGLSINAAEQDIKKAYRDLALKFHPDRNKEKNAPLMFKKIQDAYDYLTDKSGTQTLAKIKSSFRSQEIHSSLDQLFSEHSLSLTAISAAEFVRSGSSINLNTKFKLNDSPSSTIGLSASSSNLETVGSQTKKPKKGPSLQTILKLSFKETVRGCKKTIQFTHSVMCPSCSGSASGKTLCCQGTKKVIVSKTLTIDIPPGVSDGEKKIITGEGDSSNDLNGPPGDLIICFETELHPFFKRTKSDCVIEVPLSFPLAAIGGELEIPSLYDRNIPVRIAPGISNGHQIKIVGEGFFDSTTQRKGDLYININIPTPTQLTKEETELLRKLSTLPHFIPSLFSEKLK